LPILFLTFSIGCFPRAIEDLTETAEKTLVNFNIEYTSLLCFKNYRDTANCVVLTKNNNLSNMYCDITSCEMFKCEQKECLQKVKPTEKIEIPYLND